MHALPLLSCTLRPHAWADIQIAADYWQDRSDVPADYRHKVMQLRPDIQLKRVHAEA